MKRRSTVAGNFGCLLHASTGRQMQAERVYRLQSMLIYKILRASEHADFIGAGLFAGSLDDRRDGFIHCSTAEQVAGTLARHFAGDSGLWLLSLDATRFGDALRWEVSRGGAAFPHLYRPIDGADVLDQYPVPGSSAAPTLNAGTA